MTKQLEKDLEQYKDVRVAATSRIWGIAAGMLGICIPLSAATSSGFILPLALIAGAAVSTVAVWRSGEPQSNSKYLQLPQVELLEQRIANLETILSSDDLDLQRKIKQLESSDRKA